MTNAEKYRTAGDRLNAFHSFCNVYAGRHDCTRCPISGDSACDCVPTRGLAFWLDLEAETEILPCPFCGKDYVAVITDEKHECHKGKFAVECYNRKNECCYRGPWKSSRARSIAAHNRVARAVMEKDAK